MDMVGLHMTHQTIGDIGKFLRHCIGIAIAFPQKEKVGTRVGVEPDRVGKLSEQCASVKALTPSKLNVMD
jgi:hypothetical protein